MIEALVAKNEHSTKKAGVRKNGVEEARAGASATLSRPLAPAEGQKRGN